MVFKFVHKGGFAEGGFAESRIVYNTDADSADELVNAFGYFMLACGYSESTVKEFLNSSAHFKED